MIPDGRRILYRRSHGNRVIEVSEDHATRTLAFDSHLTQSRMSLADPNVLVLRYTRRMMAGLLFLEAPTLQTPFRVLMIGLGGGSLVKFLLHHFSACRMDVVENDPLLPTLARRYFHLPRELRLTLHLEDGGRFMERMATDATAGGYDLILLDAFDQAGMARDVYTDPVFVQAHARLSTRGVLVINMIRSDEALYHRGAEAIRRRFPGASLALSVPGFNNEILFAGPGVVSQEDNSRQTLEERARMLEARLKLNFSLYLQEMVRIEGGRNWLRWLRWSA
ncbi:MAG: fused MFS/spermidine synthase [Magnetococcales bacterium]|nr:fused MFS/spermidine synthase [Magnetococcales bacterium]